MLPTVAEGDAAEPATLKAAVGAGTLPTVAASAEVSNSSPERAAPALAASGRSWAHGASVSPPPSAKCLTARQKIGLKRRKSSGCSNSVVSGPKSDWPRKRCCDMCGKPSNRSSGAETAQMCPSCVSSITSAFDDHVIESSGLATLTAWVPLGEASWPSLGAADTSTSLASLRSRLSRDRGVARRETVGETAVTRSHAVNSR